MEEIERGFDVSLGDAMLILFEMGQASAAIYWPDDDDEDDSLEAVRPGDTDPTDHPTNGNHAPKWCWESDGRWICTRKDGHSGQHIAGDGQVVKWVWE